MSVLDLALNCAALLLLLNWWSRRVVVPRPSGIALVSTLRRSEPARADRWMSPSILAAILVVRAAVYFQIGPAVHWTPRLSLVAITIPFRSDSLGRMLLYSILSFVVFAGGFYCCVLLVSAVNRKASADYWQSFVRVLAGPADRAPVWLKLLLPFLLAVLFWLLCGPLLAWAGILVPAKSLTHWLAQGSLVGLAAWMVWKYVIVAVLVLHIVTSYVYFGAASFWNFISITARNLLRPLDAVNLRVGRVDFTPILVLIAVCVIVQFLDYSRILSALYAKLPR